MFFLAFVHMTACFFWMKRVVSEAHRENRYLFHQLTVGKTVQCFCLFLQKQVWLYYYLVILALFLNRDILKMCAGFFAAMLLFFLNFIVCFRSAERARSCKRKFWPAFPKRRRILKMCRNHPYLEAVCLCIAGFYRERALAAAKILSILCLLWLGEIHLLNAKLFCLIEILLILMNDGYWRKERESFLYFSHLGIPVKKYLWVHLWSGILFNTFPQTLLYIWYTGDIPKAMLSWSVLIFLLFFWYMAQVFLNLTISREKEMIITWCSLLFLLSGALFPVNLGIALWLSKKIIYLWENGDAVCR